MRKSIYNPRLDPDDDLDIDEEFDREFDRDEPRDPDDDYDPAEGDRCADAYWDSMCREMDRRSR